MARLCQHSHSCTYLLAASLAHPHNHSPTHVLSHLLTDTTTHSPMCSVAYSPTQLLTHPCAQSLTHRHNHSLTHVLSHLSLVQFVPMVTRSLWPSEAYSITVNMAQTLNQAAHCGTQMGRSNCLFATSFCSHLPVLAGPPKTRFASFCFGARSLLIMELFD